MASRRNCPENWSPVPQKITTRLARQEPQNERVQTPRSSEKALRPQPLNVPPKQPNRIEDKSAPAERKAGLENIQSPREPEIIDVGPTTSWQRRGTPSHRSTGQNPSPSLSSTRQSENSLGILDYYMREPTPTIASPEVPVPRTPKLGAAIDKFDFGLTATPTPATNNTTETPVLSAPSVRPRAGTKSGFDQPLVQFSPPSESRPSVSLNRGYTLFPIIKQTPARQPAITVAEPLLLKDLTPPSASDNVTSPPATTYRPRKESISSSVRTRNDSISSMRVVSQRAPIPLRSRPTADTSPQVFSATATPPSTTHPLTTSRWSDDTITSPSQAPTPGPRTSFGSLLRRDSAQYPACFFEDDDDDESAPLRKKFGSWGRKSGVASNFTGSGRESRLTARSGRSERKGVREIWEVEDREMKGKGEWWKAWLCGCGGR